MAVSKEMKEYIAQAEKAREERKSTPLIVVGGPQPIRQKEIIADFCKRDGFDRNDAPGGFHYYFEDRAGVGAAARTGREPVINPDTNEVETYMGDVLMRIPTELFEEELTRTKARTEQQMRAQRKRDLNSPVTTDVVEKSIEAGKPLDEESAKLLNEVKAADLQKKEGADG